MCGAQCLSPRGFHAGHPQYDRRLVRRVVMDRWRLPQPAQTHHAFLRRMLRPAPPWPPYGGHGRRWRLPREVSAQNLTAVATCRSFNDRPWPITVAQGGRLREVAMRPEPSVSNRGRAAGLGRKQAVGIGVVGNRNQHSEGVTRRSHGGCGWPFPARPGTRSVDRHWGGVSTPPARWMTLRGLSWRPRSASVRRIYVVTPRTS
jgi:hypothetical protein